MCQPIKAQHHFSCPPTNHHDSLACTDLSRAIEAIYPLRTTPDRIDGASLYPHVSASHLLDRAVVQFPVVRYRGFRPDPQPANAAGAVSRGDSPSVRVVGAATAVADAASAAWRLQQRLEFIPFEERVKRLSVDDESEDVVDDQTSTKTAVASVSALGAADSEGIASRKDQCQAADYTIMGTGKIDDGVGPVATRRSGLSPSEKIACASERKDSSISGDNAIRSNNGDDAVTDIRRAHGRKGARTFGACDAPATNNVGTASVAAGAKRLRVLLADYLGDTSTVGMVIVDQPGMGMTTAILAFMEWYCRGEAAGGRQVIERASGSCGLVCAC